MIHEECVRSCGEREGLLARGDTDAIAVSAPA
jgi:hypothetical protein